MFYVLEVSISHKHLYYAVDTKLTISRNIQDAMIFNAKGTAELFAGSIEAELEEKTNMIVTTRIIPIDINLILSGAVPATLIEQF